MKHKFLGACLALVMLAGCASLGGSGGTSAGVMKATQVALTTYAEVFQPAVIFYGHLPPCPAARICMDRAVLDKLKAADLAATNTIVAVQPILNGSQPDGGQVAAALAAITSAEAQIAGTGVLKLN